MTVSAGRELCQSCGVQAPRSGRTCAICKSPLTTPRPLSPDVGGSLYWVGVQCSFQCRVCGHRSPLNHLDIDGSVLCLSCGIEQKFDEQQWWKGVRHAHAVGDLAGPHPEGRFPRASAPIGAFNVFKSIGVSDTFAEEVQREVVISNEVTTHSLLVRAMPGHPLCKACHVPLSLVRADNTGIATECPSCHERRSYKRPPGIPPHHQALRGTLADEHLVGQKEVDVEQDRGGVTLVKCPNCHAPLDLCGRSTLTQCTYCGATSRVSTTTLRAMGHRDLEPELWWMLFNAPSPLRAELEGPPHQGPPHQGAPHMGQEAQPHGAANTEQPLKKILLVPLIAGVAPVLFLAGVALWGLTSTEPKEPPAEAFPITTSEPVIEIPELAVPPLPTLRELPETVATASNEPMEDLKWRATVRSATGRALPPGTLCELGARANAEATERTWLQCGEEILYDSRQRLSGMSNFSSGMIETEADGGAGWAYLFHYRDVGQRSGRAQIVVKTDRGTIQVEDANPGGFKVVLSVHEKSIPRSGAPLFAEKLSFAPVDLALEALETSGPAPAAKGANCQLKLTLYGVSKSGAVCQATLICAGRTAYDTSKPGHSTPCDLDEAGVPSRIKDNDKSTQDSDPSLMGAVLTGAFTLADDPPKGDWKVTLRVKPST